MIRSLGASDAVVVGHDWGGWISWSMPALEPEVTRAVAAISMAHPRGDAPGSRRAPRPGRREPLRRGASRCRSGRSASWSGAGAVEALLRKGSGTDWPGHGEEADEVVAAYTDAMRVPFVAHSAMEYYRWAVRSTWRRDGRAFVERVDRPIDVPVLHLHGARDPAVLAETARRSTKWATGGYEYQEWTDAGHFLPEERPDEVNAALLDWLGRLPGR